MSRMTKFLLVFSLFLAVLANSLFVITEFERGVKLQFGKLVDDDLQF